MTPWPLFCFTEPYLTEPPLWLDAVEKAHNQFTALHLQM